jgi:hypothetical protein
MASEQPTGPRTNSGFIQYGGTVNAQTMITGSHAKVTVYTERQKLEIERRVEELMADATHLPDEHSETKKKIRRFGNALLKETKKKAPDPEKVRITWDGLLAAAKAVSAIAPRIFETATALAKLFIR